MTWKCRDENCGRTFEVLGRISTEKKPLPVNRGWTEEVTRIIIDSPCCPFCQSLEFELLVPEKHGDT
jgi:hypothetical protein